jgi:hypothetical protein
MAKNVSSIFSMLYTGSAIAGPLIAGATMKATDADALMWFTAAAALVSATQLQACYRGARRASSLHFTFYIRSKP